MQHKISEMCDKVSVMYEMSMNLRRLKYDTPKERQDRTAIDDLVVQIQALAGDIYNDRMQHPKLVERDK